MASGPCSLFSISTVSGSHPLYFSSSLRYFPPVVLPLLYRERAWGMHLKGLCVLLGIACHILKAKIKQELSIFSMLHSPLATSTDIPVPKPQADKEVFYLRRKEVCCRACVNTGPFRGGFEGSHTLRVPVTWSQVSRLPPPHPRADVRPNRSNSHGSLARHVERASPRGARMVPCPTRLEEM